MNYGCLRENSNSPAFPVTGMEYLKYFFLLLLVSPLNILGRSINHIKEIGIFKYFEIRKGKRISQHIDNDIGSFNFTFSPLYLILEELVSLINNQAELVVSIGWPTVLMFRARDSHSFIYLKYESFPIVDVMCVISAPWWPHDPSVVHSSIWKNVSNKFWFANQYIPMYN